MRILSITLTIIVTASLAQDNPGLKRLCQLAEAGELKKFISSGAVVQDTTNPITLDASLGLDKLVLAFHDSGKLKIMVNPLSQYMTKQDSVSYKSATFNIDLMPHKVFIFNENQFILDGITENKPATLVVTFEGDASFIGIVGFSLHDWSPEGLVLKKSDGIYKAKVAATENGKQIIIQEPINFYPSPINPQRQHDRVYIENGTEYFAIIPNLENTQWRYEGGKKTKISNCSIGKIQGILQSWLRMDLEQSHGDLNKTDFMMERILLLLARYPQVTDFPFGLIGEAKNAARPIHLGCSCYITTKTFRDILREASDNGRKPLHPLTREELSEEMPPAVQNMHDHFTQRHGAQYSLDDIVDNDLISGKAFILDTEETQDIARHFIERKLNATELESIGELHGYNLEKLKELIEQKIAAPQPETGIASVGRFNDVAIQTDNVTTAITTSIQIPIKRKKSDDCRIM